MAMWQATFEPGGQTKLLTAPKILTDHRYSGLYICTGNSFFNIGRLDLLSALVSAGCCHLAIKILDYLDSTSLLAASLVCTDWQQYLLDWFYAVPKFRQRIYRAIFEQNSQKLLSNPSQQLLSTSKLTFSLALARSAIIDVTVDDDLNVFALALLSGKPHVMSCSLFTRGKKRWVHRFSEHFEPSSLTCISAGQSLVALGTKNGKIHVYESSSEFKCLRLTAILAHHNGAIHTILFQDGRILSGSDDMSVGVVTILPDGSLMLSKLLQGHVSRVRALDCHGDRVLSGSDDRTVKLWSLNSGSPSTSICTLTGHSGPVTGVLLALPLALSAAGCTVRVWDVTSKTCLKLLQHKNSPVTAMSWISTFHGVVTIDAANILRTFKLENVENLSEEIISASSEKVIENKSEFLNSQSSPSLCSRSSMMTSLQHYSPKQSLKFYSSSDPRLVTAWPDNAILKIESIPHHFTAFSIRNCGRQPTLIVHCLDYVSQ